MTVIGSRLNCKKTTLLLMSISVLYFVFIFDIQSAKLIENRHVKDWISTFDETWSNLFKTRREIKSILIWNSPHRIETSAFGLGHEPFINNGCKVSECIIYDQNSAISPLEEFDAIIIQMHELWLTHLPSFNRTEFQRVIFLTQESPSTMNIDFKLTTNYYNWTMTYRNNSDIQLLYGRIEPGPTAPKTKEEIQELINKVDLTATNYAINKTDKVAWMVSHCNTKSLREVYVDKLRQFIPVDIYGLCGNLSCSHNWTHWLSDPSCYKMLDAKYKFYLSFENSICTDYVTEKFFEIMNLNIVPVVFGGAIYDQIAPFHSYINAHFYTPEQLANYLELLYANDTLYNQYFWWKDHYRVEAGVEQMARHGFCDLCEKLHQDEGVVKYYPDVIPEWDPEEQCVDMATVWS